MDNIKVMDEKHRTIIIWHNLTFYLYRVKQNKNSNFKDY